MRYLPSTRFVRGAAVATIEHQFTDQDGEPAAPAGTVTVTVTRADGTSITPGAVAGTSTGPRTATLPAGTLADVDWLTIVWSDNAVQVATEVVEVVGGTLATYDRIKELDTSLTGRPGPELAAARRNVEDMATRVLRRSIVERFYTERVDGSGRCSLIVSWPDVLEVTRVRVWSSSTTYTDFTATELAAIPASPSGVLERTDGAVWPCGRQNIEISYRFGMRSIPGDLRTALIKSIRYELTQFNSGMMRNASRVDTADGGTITLASPGNDAWSTGDIDIDRVVNGYRFRTLGLG